MSDRVFVCYSRKDEDFVLKLAANLKRQGVPIWLDQWDIPTGANWSRTIERALKECARLLIVLTPSSVESDEVQSEWLSALDGKKIIVPILYEQCQMPFRLKPIQYIDFTSHSPDDKEALGKILNALGTAKDTLIKPGTQQEQPPERLVDVSPFDHKIQKEDLDHKKIVSQGAIVLVIALAVLSILLVGTKYYGLPGQNSQDADHWNDTGNALIAQGKLDDALQAYNKVIELDDRSAYAWGMRGYILIHKKDPQFDDALSSLERAIDLKPNIAWYWNEKGNALFYLGKASSDPSQRTTYYESALAAKNESIKLDPTFNSAWYDMALVLDEMGRYEQELNALNKSIGLNPNDEDSLWQKSVVLKRLSRTDKSNASSIPNPSNSPIPGEGIAFDAFPNGTLITSDIILRGDEFSEKGVLLAGSPESSYCGDANAVAIHKPERMYNIDFNYLSSSDPHDINRCTAVPVAITFIEPVRTVQLTFAGASVPYTMKAYDSSNALLNTVTKDAIIRGGTFTIATSTENAEIKRVTFGKEMAGTVIKEIYYQR